MARLEHFDESTIQTIEKVCKEYAEEYAEFLNNENNSEQSPVCEIQQIDEILRWITPPIPIDPFNDEVGLQFNVDFRLVALDALYNMSESVETSFYVVVSLYLYALTEENRQEFKEFFLELVNKINQVEPNVKFEYEESVDESVAPSWIEVVSEVKTDDKGVVAEDELRNAINRTLDAPYAYYSHFDLLKEI